MDCLEQENDNITRLKEEEEKGEHERRKSVEVVIANALVIRRQVFQDRDAEQALFQDWAGMHPVRKMNILNGERKRH